MWKLLIITLEQNPVTCAQVRWSILSRDNLGSSLISFNRSSSIKMECEQLQEMHECSVIQVTHMLNSTGAFLEKSSCIS